MAATLPNPGELVELVQLLSDLIGTLLELLTLLLPILLLLAFELVHARGFALLLPLTEWILLRTATIRSALSQP